MNYFSVLGSYSQQVVIERSRFICYTKEVLTEAQARLFVDEIKKKNSQATHNCYAFIVERGNYSRYSDDGEPSGTAGAPILEAIKSKNLVNTAVVVTRYFGGVKLGTGGLSRAYGGIAKDTLQQAGTKEYVFCKELFLSLDYDEYSVFSKFIEKKEKAYLKTEYFDKVNLSFAINEEVFLDFQKDFNELFRKKIQLKIIKSDYFPVDKNG